MVILFLYYAFFGIMVLVRGNPSPKIIGSPDLAVQCAVNETITRCPLCERDCSQLYLFDAWSNKSPCPESCHTNAPICVCKPGFFRNPSGDCVVEKECPPPCPWANEVPNYCDQPFEPRCQPSCSNPVNYPNGTVVVLDWVPAGSIPEFYCQYGICHTLVCACKKGYVRHDETWRCIKQEECPSPSTDTNQKERNRLKPAPRVEDDDSAKKFKDVTWSQIIGDEKSTASTKGLPTSETKEIPAAGNFKEKITPSPSSFSELERQNPILPRVISVSSIIEDQTVPESAISTKNEETKESSRNSVVLGSEKAGTDGVRFFWVKP